jgi:hypothetical protein
MTIYLFSLARSVQGRRLCQYFQPEQHARNHRSDSRKTLYWICADRTASIWGWRKERACRGSVIEVDSQSSGGESPTKESLTPYWLGVPNSTSDLALVLESRYDCSGMRSLEVGVLFRNQEVGADVGCGILHRHWTALSNAVEPSIIPLTTGNKELCGVMVYTGPTDAEEMLPDVGRRPSCKLGRDLAPNTMNHVRRRAVSAN